GTHQGSNHLVLPAFARQGLPAGAFPAHTPRKSGNRGNRQDQVFFTGKLEIPHARVGSHGSQFFEGVCAVEPDRGKPLRSSARSTAPHRGGLCSSLEGGGPGGLAQPSPVRGSRPAGERADRTIRRTFTSKNGPRAVPTEWDPRRMAGCIGDFGLR